MRLRASLRLGWKQSRSQQDKPVECLLNLSRHNKSQVKSNSKAVKNRFHLAPRNINLIKKLPMAPTKLPCRHGTEVNYQMLFPSHWTLMSGFSRSRRWSRINDAGSANGWNSIL